jgi:putative sterol carrier protein
MVSTAREFFTEQSNQPRVPRLAGVKGTYDFAIDGRDHWFMRVDDGNVTVSQTADLQAHSDCVIACSEEDFVGIVNGERNLLTHALRGRVQVSGNLALAQNFSSFARSRKASATRGGQP